MALQVGGTFYAQDLPEYLYQQVKGMVDKFNPLEPSALPEPMRSFTMTRADFLNEVRTRINSLFSVWYVQNEKLGYAPYLLKLLANVWTIASRCRYCAYTVGHGGYSNGGTVPDVRDSYAVYKVIFRAGKGTVAGRKTNNPEIPVEPQDLRTRLSISSVVKPGSTIRKLPTGSATATTTSTATKGFTPANIGDMPENYKLYEIAEGISAGALAKGQLITVGATLKTLCSSFATEALNLSNNTYMPAAEAFKSDQNIQGLGVPSNNTSWATYAIPGFVSMNNQAAFGYYTCHSNCHSNCHGHRNRR